MGPLTRAALLGVAIAAAAPLAGCKDQGKISSQKAAEDCTFLAKLAETDVAEIERGLPEGAKRLAPLWTAKLHPRDDLPGLRTALIKVRRDVPDLNVSKSTFFAVADETGIALRNNLEQDSMAGKDLLALYPDLAKAKDGYTVTTGAFPETSSQAVEKPEQRDKDWIAAVPIKQDEKLVGFYLGGWTFRRFAYHLQESLRHELSEKLRKEGDTGKLPIFYVAIFDRTGVYGAPKTPPVNEKTLADMDLVGKTAQGAHQAAVNITDREFGFGAVRTPKLGVETGIVVLRSEL